MAIYFKTHFLKKMTLRQLVVSGDGNLVDFQRRVQRYQDSLHSKDPVYGRTLLMECCFYNRHTFVQLLLSDEYVHKIDLNAVDREGKTALMYVADEALLHRMLDLGTDPYQLSNQGYSVLHHACVHNMSSVIPRLDYPPIVNSLWKRPQKNQFLHALLCVTQMGKEDSFRALLRLQHLDINTLNFLHAEVWSALSYYCDQMATDEEAAQRVRWLLALPHINVHIGNQPVVYLVVVAMRTNPERMTDILGLLIERGAALDIRHKGDTPLCCAVRDNNVHAVKALLEAGAGTLYKTSRDQLPEDMITPHSAAEIRSLLLRATGRSTIDVFLGDPRVRQLYARKQQLDLIPKDRWNRKYHGKRVCYRLGYETDGYGDFSICVTIAQALTKQLGFDQMDVLIKTRPLISEDFHDLHGLHYPINYNNFYSSNNTKEDMDRALATLPYCIEGDGKSRKNFLKLYKRFVEEYKYGLIFANEEEIEFPPDYNLYITFSNNGSFGDQGKAGNVLHLSFGSELDMSTKVDVYKFGIGLFALGLRPENVHRRISYRSAANYTMMYINMDAFCTFKDTVFRDPNPTKNSASSYRHVEIENVIGQLFCFPIMIRVLLDSMSDTTINLYCNPSVIECLEKAKGDKTALVFQQLNFFFNENTIYDLENKDLTGPRIHLVPFRTMPREEFLDFMANANQELPLLVTGASTTLEAFELGKKIIAESNNQELDAFYHYLVQLKPELRELLVNVPSEYSFFASISQYMRHPILKRKELLTMYYDTCKTYRDLMMEDQSYDFYQNLAKIVYQQIKDV